MKKLLVFGAALAFAASAMAEKNSELDTIGGKHLFPAKGQSTYAGGGGGGSNLSYYGGNVIVDAKFVGIFWGNEWNGASSGIQTEMIQFLNQFGNTGEYNTITQYYGKNPVNGSSKDFIHKSTALATTWVDTNTPPAKVTDSMIIAEVENYLSNHGGTRDISTVYSVFLPSTSYSDDGSGRTSCGGPNLYFCAYHGAYKDSGGRVIKYASIPYPSCSGCKTSGFTNAQNFEHFLCHEIREAVTDPDQYSGGTQTWRDGRGYEADDKCAWSPTPFIGTGGFAYQYEWSNANRGCVKTR